MYERGGRRAASLAAHRNGDENEEYEIEGAESGDQDVHALPVEAVEEPCR